jgi:hypothetical protein
MIVLLASALPADKTAAITLACIEYIFSKIKDNTTYFYKDALIVEWILPSFLALMESL